MWAERKVRRLTKGRYGLIDIARLPSLQITVPGRKSGIVRTTPLLYVPDGANILLVGSGWGAPKHPAWALNAAAVDTVTIQRGKETVEAAIREFAGAERDAAWQRAITFWPGYAMEQRLATGREFKLFELVPRTD